MMISGSSPRTHQEILARENKKVIFRHNPHQIWRRAKMMLLTSQIWKRVENNVAKEVAARAPPKDADQPKNSSLQALVSTISARKDQAGARTPLHDLLFQF